MSRIITAERYRGEELLETVDIHAHTKHGTTEMLSVMPPQKLEPGDILKTSAWIFGARNFFVLCEHVQPMKIPGKWYEVRIVAHKKK